MIHVVYFDNEDFLDTGKQFAELSDDEVISLSNKTYDSPESLCDALNEEIESDQNYFRVIRDAKTGYTVVQTVYVSVYPNGDIGASEVEEGEHVICSVDLRIPIYDADLMSRIVNRRIEKGRPENDKKGGAK